MESTGIEKAMEVLGREIVRLEEELETQKFWRERLEKENAELKATLAEKGDKLMALINRMEAAEKEANHV